MADTVKTQNQTGKGQEQIQSNPTEKEDKFPDMDNLTEEDKKKWFTVDEIAGYTFLKVKPEMFTPPTVEGPAVFLGKVATYKSQEKETPTLVFENDF